MTIADAPVFSRHQREEVPGKDGRRYTIAPLIYREKQAFSADMTRAGYFHPGQLRIFAAMREALRQIAPDNLPDLLLVVDEYEANPPGQALPPAVQMQVDVIEAAVRAVPGFAVLVAQRDEWWGAMPLFLLSHALRGWEGESLPPFTRKNGRVPLDLIEVMEADIELVGFRAWALTHPTPSAEKNSVAPSPAAETEGHSPAA